MQRQRMRCLYKVASINVQSGQNSAAKIQLKVGISGNFEEVFMIKGEHGCNFKFTDFRFRFFITFATDFIGRKYDKHIICTKIIIKNKSVKTKNQQHTY